MSLVSLIAAMARNRVIGRQNRMPWHVPEDLRRFRRLTMGAPVIMGRKTHESLGRPLPGRRNIVVTRQRNASWPGCETAPSLTEALDMTRDASERFVIGGAELYRLALPLADRLYLTLIDADYDGDTWFPEVDWSAWRERSREHSTAADGKVDYDFLVYERALP
jgi:dihydrofolate reductase